MTATSLTLRSSDGTVFSAVEALAGAHNGPRSGVVILPDVRGLDQPYVDLASRFASEAISAVAIDYFGRTAGARHWQAPLDWEPHAARVDAAGIARDVAAAVLRLRSGSGGNCAHVFTLGFGLGGPHAWLQSAAGLGLAGVIGFYARTEPPTPDGSRSPVERVREITCPLLGLFGGVDTAVLPPALAGFDAALSGAGVPHSLVMYSRAGHGFFDRRPSEFPEAAADAWRRVLEFVSEAAIGDTSSLVTYVEIGRPSPPPLPAPAATSAPSTARAAAGVVTKGQYFPPPESRGGWRVAAERREIQGHGFDPDGLEEFGEWNASIQHSPPRPPSQFGIVVIHDGWIIYEKYDRPETRAWPRWIASIGKSITSCQFGRWLDAGARGQLSQRLELDGSVYTTACMPEGFPLSDERKTAITFFHLLTHTSGLQPEPDTRGGAGYRWVDYTVGRHPLFPESARLVFDPGKGFGYSSVGFNHFAVIAPHVAGRMLHDSIAAEIFGPIGAESASWHRPADGEAAAYEDPEGRYRPGAGGPHLTTRDLARYAYMHLNDGAWAGRQVVPAWYLKQARRVVRLNDAQRAGYGLGFWSNDDGGFSEHLPREAFGFGGAGLNLVVVVPSHRLVVVRTSRIWTAGHGLPSFDAVTAEFTRRAAGLLKDG